MRRRRGDRRGLVPDPTRMDVWSIPLDGGAPLTTHRWRRLRRRSRRSRRARDLPARAVGGGARRRTAHGARAAVRRRAARAGTDHRARDRRASAGVTTTSRSPGRARSIRRAVIRCCLNVYGGPHAQMVLDARDTYVMDQWYADAGFIVVRSDNRGTPGPRPRVGARDPERPAVTSPLADQVGALQAVGARYPELDLGRVGVFGWSFGGYLSAMAVLLRPDVFTCGDRRRAGHRLVALRHRVHRALHANARAQPGGLRGHERAHPRGRASPAAADHPRHHRRQRPPREHARADRGPLRRGQARRGRARCRARTWFRIPSSPSRASRCRSSSSASTSARRDPAPRCPVVAVAKPSGIATHRGWDDGDDALLQQVRDAVNAYVYPVHRLDRGASGIVLFALDKRRRPRVLGGLARGRQALPRDDPRPPARPPRDRPRDPEGAGRGPGRRGDRDLARARPSAATRWSRPDPGPADCTRSAATSSTSRAR